MGLSIKKYHYPYGRLHDLRSAALKVEKSKVKLMCKDYGFDSDEPCNKCFYCTYETDKSLKTEFPNFIYYYDNQGGYISQKSKQLNKTKYKDFGNLDELKRECAILDKKIKKHLGEGQMDAWHDYYDDVVSSKMILEYR